MSASMPIPPRKHSRNPSSPASASSLSAASDNASSFDPASSALPSYSPSRHIMSPSSGSSSSSPQPILSSKAKQKAPVTAAAASSPPPDRISARRPSLLGSSLSHSEYTVINLGHSDGPPRLVTCVKSSQGFDWNQELFLPSYADYDSLDLEHRPDPVQEIVLTDEEAAAMFPQW